MLKKRYYQLAMYSQAVVSMRCALGFSAVFLCAGISRAQSTQAPHPPAQQDPRVLFEQGRAAMEQERYADAVAPFERSYALRPSPVVMYNLAVAYRALGRMRDSIQSFERYLESPSRTATPAELQTVRAEVATMRSRLCTLTVQLTPAETQLRINGHPETPQNGTIVLDPGSTVIELSAPGYHPQRVTLTLRQGGRETLNRTMLREVTTGHVSITASDARAAIFIDDVQVGSGTIEEDIAPGEHRVRAVNSAGRSEARTVNVVRGGHNRLEISFPTQRGLPGWVVPVAVVGGALVAGGATALVLYATTPRPYDGSMNPNGWVGNVMEKRRP